MKRFTLQKGNLQVDLYVSSNHLYSENVWDEDSRCDVVSCTAKTGFVFLNSFLDRSLNSEIVIKKINETNLKKRPVLLDENSIPVILTPTFRAMGGMSRKGSRDLMGQVLNLCEQIRAKSLRITQYGFLRERDRSEEWSGVMEAVLQHLTEVHAMRKIFFDLDKRQEDKFAYLIKEFTSDE